MKRTLLAFLALVLATSLPAQQKKQLTLEAIYEPVKKVNFSGSVQSGFAWLDDATFVWPRKNDKNELDEWRMYNVEAGVGRTYFSRAKIDAALQSAGVSSDAARAAAARSTYTFDEKKTAMLIDADDDLYVYDFTRNRATRLTSAKGDEKVATFSPDGKKVAFVRDNDLYVVDLAGRETRITRDGGEKTLNGILDWLYQEEVFGRGRFQAYWWSPDSSRLAFLQLDETPVPEFTVVDHIPYRQELQVYPYPKPGDPNPKVKLFIVPATGGTRVEADHQRYAKGEHLIVSVDWRPDGSEVIYQVQDREQTWLDLVTADRKGATKVLLRETTKAWVDALANPHWLDDGSFLWQSERTGWRHLYHYKPDGTLIRRVTDGEWEVRDVHGIDKNGWIFFSGTERSPIGSDVYRIKLDGTGLQRLSQQEGTHAATFNPSLTRYVDKWSDLWTPDQVRVHTNDGTLVRVVEENRAATLAEYALPRPELLQVKARDGFVMEAMMIKPPNFDPSKKYPVYQFLYAGPHAQQVRNAWRGQQMLFNQLIANEGVIVWMMDNRTASGKGAVSAWPAYRQLGVSELRDLEDGVAWLKAQPYVDGSRILLNGWSYGGFMVAYALTHSKSFSAGIAGGTVADWRDYDSIYTERVMLLPKNNEEGYKKSSPRFAAADLHGDLLLLHGTIDDNVHMQNTIQFAYELQKAGKLFEMMLYPKSRHGVTNPALQYHMQGVIFDFVKRKLK
jgi:dipeptidyl-peptidase-4